jgi:hypothetical protein
VGYQFNKIYQFRNIEVSKLFALNAHDTSIRMEAITAEMHESTRNMEKVTESMHTIADKTEKETASMHIITLVTLVFLPGTFVAVSLGPPLMRQLTESLTTDQTFFGSGLFQWVEENTGELPVWKPEYFKLFAKICFPLMGGTIVIWLLATFWARWTQPRTWRNANDVEKAGEADDVELSQLKKPSRLFYR